MKGMKKKYILAILLLLSILPNIYQNYIYYKIPTNPLMEINEDNLVKCYFTDDSSDLSIDKSIDNVKNNTLIFEYFCSLKLVPLNEKRNKDEIYKHLNSTFFSYGFNFENPSYYIFINEIWLDNLTILSIRSNKLNFKEGYYKIIDTEFDYNYINGLFYETKN